MDGIWTFTIPARQGGGVVAARNGKLYGGDIKFFITGTYRENGNSVEADLRVSDFNPHVPILNVWGDGASSFNVSFKGTRANDVVTGKIQRQGVPIAFDAVLTRRADVP